MRTITNISQNLEPIDKILEEQFLPALFGHDITENERELLALPVKEGGMGIRCISANAAKNQEASRLITAPLIRQIILQSDVLPSDEEVQNARTKTMEKIRKDQQQNVENVHLKQSPELQRKITQITEPGASSWLGCKIRHNTCPQLPQRGVRKHSSRQHQRYGGTIVEIRTQRC